MKITYDPQKNAVYIRFREKRAAVETLRISDDLNIDLAPEGTVYGIELLNANEQLALRADGKLVLVDEARGKTHGAALPWQSRAARSVSAGPLVSQRWVRGRSRL